MPNDPIPSDFSPEAVLSELAEINASLDRAEKDRNLRDFFAVHSLDIAAEITAALKESDILQGISRRAYMLADAMMEARNK